MTTRLRQEPRTALRAVLTLVCGYLGLSVLTLAAAVLLRHHASIVTDAVWIRGTIVLASALLMTALAARTARGSRRAYLRLRIASAVMVVAIAVIVSLPGLFPVWMRIEQGACGLLLLGVVLVANGSRLRSAFAAE
ncbi:MAG TPA: hypothetical protein VF053_04385 [Streptosporangiales bacterium]